MDLPPLRLLGDRILIKPLANDTQTASGLILMEHRKPETMGEVIAVGTCAHPLKAEG
jgi:co-chaperonin GroES (HSP10)